MKLEVFVAGVALFLVLLLVMDGTGLVQLPQGSDAPAWDHGHQVP